MKKWILSVPIVAQAIAAGMLSLAYFDHHNSLIGWISLGLLFGMLISIFTWKEYAYR